MNWAYIYLEINRSMNWAYIYLEISSIQIYFQIVSFVINTSGGISFADMHVQFSIEADILVFFVDYLIKIFYLPHSLFL
jgi:hypothetical protein